MQDIVKKLGLSVLKDVDATHQISGFGWPVFRKCRVIGLILKAISYLELFEAGPKTAACRHRNR